MGGSYQTPVPPAPHLKYRNYPRSSGKGIWWLPSNRDGRLLPHLQSSEFGDRTFRGAQLPALRAGVVVVWCSQEVDFTSWRVVLPDLQQVILEQDKDTPLEAIFAQIALVGS